LHSTAKQENRGLISKDDMQQLLHVFSHDLRNPLINLEALLRDSEQHCIGDSATPEQWHDMRENMTMMQSVVQGMNQRIHGVQEVYHAIFEPVHTESVNIKALLDVEIEGCRRDACLGDSVSVSLQVDGEVWADALMLRNMFRELLHNAAQALQGHAEAHISIEQSQRRGMDVFSVRDCGIGISAHDQQCIFQPFFSLVQRNGLGLAKVKAWVQAHGGEVWCESKEDVGSIFYISLPEKKTGMDVAI